MSACFHTAVQWAPNPHVDDTGQRADVSTPRADCQFLRCDRFCRWHQKLKNEASGYKPARNSSNLVLVGDSMIEALRVDAPKKKVATASLQTTAVGRYWPRALLLGSGGAETQHVLWRLQDGELTQKMRSDRRLLIGLLIGTNNLGAGHRSREVAAGIDAIARHILSTSHAKLLIVALLPRGDRWRISICPGRCERNAGARVPIKGSRPSEVAGTAPKFCPSACARRHALSSWMPAIEAVNRRLRDEIVPTLKRQFASRVRFADCGRRFLPRPGVPVGGNMGRLWVTPSMARSASRDVNLTYLPDGLHLSAIAYAVLMECVTQNLFSIHPGSEVMRVSDHD